MMMNDYELIAESPYTTISDGTGSAAVPGGSYCTEDDNDDVGLPSMLLRDQ